jgi:large subunit ribosomal protein LP0
MGKNTMIRRVIKTEYKNFEALLPFIVDNIGLLFTDGDLTEVRDAVLAQRVAAPAKAGAVAPVDVTIPAGDTGLEPTQTAFLQALNIATRINKGQIAILNEKKVVTAGEKVGPSEAALLQKLKIKPFSYGLTLKQIYEDGLCYEPSVLDLSNDELYKKLAKAATKIAQLSLQIGFPTLPSIPHSLTRAFKSLVSIAVTTEITFPQAEDIKELLENPEALAAALAAPSAAAPAAAAEAAPAAPAEESESEEDMDFGLFD